MLEIECEDGALTFKRRKWLCLLNNDMVFLKCNCLEVLAKSQVNIQKNIENHLQMLLLALEKQRLMTWNDHATTTATLAIKTVSPSTPLI